MVANSVRTGIAAAVALLSLAVPLGAWGGDLAPELLAEVNLARTDPAAYARHLREFRSRFRGRLYRLPQAGSYMRTVEGVSAVDEAIRALRRQKPVPPLAWSDGLAASAEELVDEQRESGGTGHNGGPRGGLQDRVERQGRWEGEIGETIYYGPREPRQVVMQLIIDDGVAGRGHRKAIFSRAFRTAGASCGPHPRYDGVCAVDFATVFGTAK